MSSLGGTASYFVDREGIETALTGVNYEIRRQGDEREVGRYHSIVSSSDFEGEGGRYDPGRVEAFLV